MKKILIIESPGKQKTIQKYLGSEWKVVASLGHIRGLEQNLNFLKNDFEPSYEFIKEKAKAIKELKEEAKNCDVYLGADRDYEGEQIAYSVCLLLKLNPQTAKRVTFTEITEKALKTAIDNPGIIDMNRVHTQKTRAVLDMMIGFTMSPLLWKYVAQSLSAGRCQTPALRLVVEREDKIHNFKVSTSWQLQITWIKEFTFIGNMELEEEESVLEYMESVYNIQDASIISKEITPWSEKAPEPLITSTLQQQASAMFHINPKETMRIAQQLYEAGHITYMRTDKAVISDDAAKEAKEWVTKNYGDEFVGEKKKEAKKGKEGKEGKQEAHEAIRPTHMDVTSIDGATNKIYNLIWQRTIQSVMSPAKGEKCNIVIELGEGKWHSHWKCTTFEGWKRAGKVAKIDDDSDNEESTDWEKATQLEVGETVNWLDIKAEPKETKAQGRYTEATLIRELEKFGIGRPSTFASLLSTIQEKNYVEMKNINAKEITVKEYSITPNTWPAKEKEVTKKVGAEKNKLVPTDLGRSVLQFMLKHFDDLFNYGFTSQMEKRLDKVAEGDDWKKVLRDMWESYKDRYEELMNGTNAFTTQNRKIKDFNGIKAVQSKNGPILLIEGKTEGKEETQFLGWPAGVTFEDMTEELALQFKETNKLEEIGKWNNEPIIKKRGKFGDYLQCGSISITYQVEDLEKTIERLNAKQNDKKNTVQFKEYVIRTGQYGPYIMKTTLKKPQFVSLPKGLNASTLTEKEVESIYKTGLETKKKFKKF
jgi:DNA topoisomerase-1